ncbi:hypothetical protein VPH35_068382 [Triticum aestivum]
MVGSRRRRRGRGRLLQEGAEPSQLADATLICREVATVERPSKNTCLAQPQPLPPWLYLDLMFVQISWTACFMKSLLSLTHSVTSLLSLALAALGALQSLPFPLCIHSASRHST